MIRLSNSLKEPLETLTSKALTESNNENIGSLTSSPSRSSGQSMSARDNWVNWQFIARHTLGSCNKLFRDIRGYYA